ncbi:hypothetical protein C9374_004853 [Naegleria lovaniensis]|uniref:Uncharacterized protein n=1 Tax=Naegleria lovaniensis TaxID=51637 RepID=A0AA88GPH4_NAELO|nr:uncharacterized protein C9374_004853 [Naegleria lovaniensis]KAG2382886.1 hypothetical protein C9374_004853 [Naegleria lovaniensis]
MSTSSTSTDQSQQQPQQQQSQHLEVIRTETATYSSPQINKFKEQDNVDDAEMFSDFDMNSAKYRGHHYRDPSNIAALQELEDWSEFDQQHNDQ